MSGYHFPFKFQYKDLISALAVFLVAIPLCLGISNACHLPMMSGIISGIIGGIIVGFISDSPLSVSGPAAGLITLILAAVNETGSFEKFLVVIFFAGLFQIILGFFKMGKLTRYIPHNVIEGMMAGIGLILIIKQSPFLIGRDIHHTYHIEALLISVIGLASLVAWDKFASHRVKRVPGSLIVVILGLVISYIYHLFWANYSFDQSYFVHLPQINKIIDLQTLRISPDWKHSLNSFIVYKHALIIGLVASIESLLSINGIEKLSTEGKKADKDRELFAQGIGNMVAGLLGGLPIASVIVRSTVNLNAGAKSKFSAIFHGFYLLIAVVFLAVFINRIPLVSLSAILVFTGYKLAHPKHFFISYKMGFREFIPFIATFMVVAFVDFLSGVALGLSLYALFFQIGLRNQKKI